MEAANHLEAHVSKKPTTSRLQTELKTVSEKCINCSLCQAECEFLRRYGKPKEIADAYDPDNPFHPSMSFECSLCQLCSAVCPFGINPAKMFLEMRREAIIKGNGVYDEHASILAYEKRGTSKRYTWYNLPEACDTVFFPGCTLPGAHPEITLSLFNHMKKQVPSLGIVLDCCTNPSHDLGRDFYFHTMFQEMKDFLIENGIKKVFVACPNCHKIFKKYGGKLLVQTVYEFLATNGGAFNICFKGTVTIHDPCALRFNKPVHTAIRNLIAKQGLTIEEMIHSREKTICCGEGGAVNCVAPEISNKWRKLRKQEAGRNRVVTYCAGCENLLNKITPSSHILDLLFKPGATMNGKTKVAKPPRTYLNRLMVKRHLKRKLKNSVSREREFKVEENSSSGGNKTRTILFLLILIAVFTIHLTGVHQYLDQETLKQMVQGHIVLAPIIYMLFYMVAPALLLPGLPITVAGGILFGPFWGIVYAIVGSTLGACLAFLISRYIAREWIESKLKHSKWQRLDQGVERHGWKVVAFTRLIPLFPFNLLNYAFGLTKIKFFHYAITTFIFMLPGCIAYIVFSSSLLDLLRGKISPSFIVGLFLVILVSLIPFLYKRYKAKKGISDPL